MAMSRIRSELEKSRADLLDLGLRNTLLNHRRLKSKGLEVIDELPREVLRILVKQERAMSFLPAPDDLLEPEERRVRGDLLTEWLEQHEMSEDAEESGSVANRHQDTKLQTPYSAARLERRLLNTFYAARSTIEEQGVNTLYLALGMLRWFESRSSEIERSAPLILLPVSLSRTSARTRFRIHYTGEDLRDNLSLQKKLWEEFRVKLPSLPATEDLDPDGYFDQVSAAVREQKDWRVDEAAIHLGFFWFTKLLMYEDLDPEQWRSESPLDEHPVLGPLLGDGFKEEGSPFSEEASLDEQVDLADLHHIRDADSSQTLAILDVHAGRNMVIQGPPGTGKSQTISNLIAENIARGKRVLFVAEKMAALDVVKRRLDEDRVGDACLELHSHRSNKRIVLEELRRTLALGKPEFSDVEEMETLEFQRDRLNDYASAVNRPIGQSGVSPYKAYGEALAASDRLAEEENRPILKQTTGWADWTGAEFRERAALLKEVELLLERIGVPIEHSFWSSCRGAFLPRDRDRLSQLSDDLKRELSKVRKSLCTLAAALDLQPPSSFPEATRLLTAAQWAAKRPKLDGIAVGDSSWHEERERLGELIGSGLRYRALHDQFDAKLLPEAWSRDVLALRSALVQFGNRWWRFLAPEFRRAIRELRNLSQLPVPKKVEKRLSLVDAIRESQQLERGFAEENELLQRLFGDHWQGPCSDWHLLSEAFAWLRDVHEGIRSSDLPTDFLSCTTVTPDSMQLHEAAREAEGDLNRLAELLGEVESFLELYRGNGWLRRDGAITVSFEDLDERISGWQSHPDSVQDIIRFNNLTQQLQDLGLVELSKLSAHWLAARRHLVDLLSYAWYNELIEHALGEREELSHFDGDSHRLVLERFQELDQELIEANRARVALAHWEQLPPRNGAGQLAGPGDYRPD